MYKTITIENTNGIFKIIYNNPPRNFIIVQFLYELFLAFSKAENDSSVKVILLLSNDKNSFVSHSDISEIVNMTNDTQRIPYFLIKPIVYAISILDSFFIKSSLFDKYLLSLKQEEQITRIAPFLVLKLFNLIENSSKITITGIRGICIGGGFEMSMCFDFRIMSNSPETKIGQPEILIGIIPGYGGTQRMSRIIGPAKTLELQLSGDLINSIEAEKLGLIYKSVNDNNFDNEINTFSKRMANKPSNTVKHLKRAVKKGFEKPLRKGIYIEMEEIVKSLSYKETKDLMKKYSYFLESELKKDINEQNSVSEVLEKLDKRML